LKQLVASRILSGRQLKAICLPQSQRGTAWSKPKQLIGQQFRLLLNSLSVGREHFELLILFVECDLPGSGSQVAMVF
jgi:hypothetical protein